MFMLTVQQNVVLILNRVRQSVTFVTERTILVSGQESLQNDYDCSILV